MASLKPSTNHLRTIPGKDIYLDAVHPRWAALTMTNRAVGSTLALNQPSTSTNGCSDSSRTERERDLWMLSLMYSRHFKTHSSWLVFKTHILSYLWVSSQFRLLHHLFEVLDSSSLDLAVAWRGAPSQHFALPTWGLAKSLALPKSINFTLP